MESDEIINTGFAFQYFPNCFMLGVTVDWSGMWKTNPVADTNCRRYWLCINFMFWQISYRGVYKVYGIRND